MDVSAAPSPSPVFSFSWLQGRRHDSSSLITDRLRDALCDHSVLILHRSQWQCLVKSYTEVLLTLSHLSQHLCPDLLHVLDRSMQDGENGLQDCTTCLSHCSHSWLMEKALKLGLSTDVVDVHLHDLLWSFSAILDGAATQIYNLESFLVELTRKLSDIWKCQDATADVLETCNFLNAYKIGVEGETSYLANFISLKLSNAVQDMEVMEPNSLPDYLWSDPGSLKRQPEIIGLGSYGKVHEAIWLGGRFAVKDFLYVEDNISFGKEAAIQARVRHPNVLPLVCCTESPSSHACSLVMELMEKDLRSLLIDRRKAGIDPPFSLAVAIDLMLDIAQGVEYLHSLHIMHRDLKATNMLVSLLPGGRRAVDDVSTRIRLKVADFGMSKAKQGSSKYTTREVGAAPWRAPEIDPQDDVEDGTNAKYTNKADVYSFAMVCHEILTGKWPFEGSQVRKRVLAGERPLLPPYCPPALSSYIERCWDAKPSRRPPFRQICRMLRYVKACIHLQEYWPSRIQPGNGWLSLQHPLPMDLCNLIEDMFSALVDTPIHPKPLGIPLEMYCCARVLKGRDGNNGSHDRINQSMPIIPFQRQERGFIKTFMKLRRLIKGRVQHSDPRKVGIGASYRTQETELRQQAISSLRVFRLEELKLATADFAMDCFLGEGMFGVVYKGWIDVIAPADGQRTARIVVAVKLLKETTLQDHGEWLAEVRMLGQLHHPNLVKVIGYCHEGDRRLLVYEFMANRSLDLHLFRRASQPLSWATRMEIALGVARALAYLHGRGESAISHGLLQASSVLLDLEYKAKLSGFLAVKGDSKTGQTLWRIDVYSFGVVLLELLAGRQSMEWITELQFAEQKLPEEWQLLALMDPRLQGDYSVEGAQKAAALAFACLNCNHKATPSMYDVVQRLEPLQSPR